MAHFSESLCEEVIKSEGKCGLTRNEMVQMARFALRAIRNENPLMPDALRYRYLRHAKLKELLAMFPTTDTSDVGLDHAIFTEMAGGGPEARSCSVDEFACIVATILQLDNHPKTSIRRRIE